MGHATMYAEPGTSNQFSIYYPYYGLFSTAEVFINEREDLFQCKLTNGNVISLRKALGSRKWIDVQENRITPLATIIGNYIDDFLGRL
jgi:hypothetical protein